MSNIRVAGMQVSAGEVVGLDKLKFLGNSQEDITFLINTPPKGYFVIELPHENGLVYVEESTIKNEEELTIHANERIIGSIIGKEGVNIKLVLEQIKRIYPKSNIRKLHIEKM